MIARLIAALLRIANRVASDTAFGGVYEPNETAEIQL